MLITYMWILYTHLLTFFEKLKTYAFVMIISKKQHALGNNNNKSIV